MPRFLAVFAGACVLLIAGTSRAADNPAEGTWKLSFPIEEQRIITFLFMLSESDKGWVGDFLGTSIPLKVEPTIDKVVVKDGNVSFDVKLGKSALGFDGKIAKDGKKIPGSFNFNGNMFLVDLMPSQLKNFNDKFAMARESLDLIEGTAEFFDAALGILSQATVKKLKADEVRALVDRTARLADGYGPRWQRIVALRLASSLADQEAYASIALEQARLAERLLKADDEPAVQLQVLQVLATTLKKAGKTNDAALLEARLMKLEARDYVEYSKKLPPFKPEEYTGRKNKSDRAVLVELFTGAECPPCVGADLAFDGLQATYKPTDVILLQYHLNVPGPDPLANKDTQERAEFYGRKAEGTPSVFFSGKKEFPEGGPASASKAMYGAYRETIDEILEKPATAKLQLTASQKGGDITIKANVNDLANPSDKTSLRFAITEERVRYQGGNGLRYHHNVVRALPGGAKGFPLTKKSSEHTASINVDKLREQLAAYLAENAKTEEYPNAERPMALKNLRVVAFIQDDATGEILQAAQVEVEDKKAE